MNFAAIALSIFALSYLLFIIFPAKRAWVAIFASVLLIVSGTIPFSYAFLKAINWNVMGIFVGTLAICDIFIKSRAPAYIAEIIVAKSRNTTWAILFICMLTGFISAFVENVATVLIVAPIAMSLAKKLKINPINMMISIAISSNLQGCATLIGDPPSMLLAGFAKMTFFDFFVYKSKPSIFFAVQIGAVASMFVLYFVFRKETEKPAVIAVEKVKSWIPSWILVLTVLALALSSFFDSEFSCVAGIICMLAGVISIFWGRFANKEKFEIILNSLDWDTTFFLIGIFVLVGSITYVGWLEVFANFLSGIVGDRLFLGYILLVFLAMILSAFIDNVPFLAAMLPVAMKMSDTLGIDSSLFLFGLLIGASLGGNITPIGASANIVACGILKKEGYEVSFGRFAKIGLPFTIAALSVACLFVWFIFGP
jgi:Na+/H+ antiporter NhaD/arsenite permease-like protein